MSVFVSGSAIQMVSINEIRNKIRRWQILLPLAVLCVFAVTASVVYANPGISSQCVVIVTAVPNMIGNPSANPSGPLSNQLSHLLPVPLITIGIVAAFVLRGNAVLAVTVLLTTAVGTSVLMTLVNQLW